MSLQSAKHIVGTAWGYATLDTCHYMASFPWSFAGLWLTWSKRTRLTSAKSCPVAATSCCFMVHRTLQVSALPRSLGHHCALEMVLPAHAGLSRGRGKMGRATLPLTALPTRRAKHTDRSYKRVCTVEIKTWNLSIKYDYLSQPKGKNEPFSETPHFLSLFLF